MRLYVLALFLLPLSNLQAQKVNIDSLLVVWNDTSLSDTVRLEAMDNVSNEGYLFVRPDSAFYYAQIEYDFADQVGQKLYMATASNTQGISLAIRGDLDNGLFYIRNSAKLYHEINNLKGESSCINNIGNIYKLTRQLDSSRFYYKKSMEIRESINDQNGVASCLIGIGNVYSAQDEYDSALVYYYRAIEKLEEVENYNTMAVPYNNVAGIYSTKGNFEEAIKAYDKSIQIDKRANNIHGYASSLSNSGRLYHRLGDYTKSISNYEESIRLRKEIQDYKGLITTYNNLSDTYIDQGNYEDALKYTEQSLIISKEIGDKEGEAASYTYIAIINQYQGNYDTTLHYYLRSYEIYKELDIKVEIASSLNNLGMISRILGNYDQALDYQFQSLKIREEIGHETAIINSHLNIASVYYSQGNYDKALEYGEKAFEEARKINLAQVWSHASKINFQIYSKLQQPEKIKHYADNIEDLRLKDIQINYSTLSESQKEKYFTLMRSDFDYLFDFAIRHPELHEEQSRAYNNTLVIKGLHLKSYTMVRNAILNSDDQKIKDQFTEWMALKRQIAESFSSGKDISELQSKANELEKKLMTESQAFYDINQYNDLSWEGIQKNLKKGETAVEFLRFDYQRDVMDDSSLVPIYIALIIDENSEYPKIVELFEEEKLVDIIGKVPGSKLEYVNQLYGTNKQANTDLYELIWKPIEPFLKNSNKVFISPDGLLHKISFAAISKKDGKFLSDEYEIETLTSTANIVKYKGKDKEFDPNSSYLLYGGVDYNTDSTKNKVWSYLEGTKKETSDISELLTKNGQKHTYLSGSEATEEKFKTEAPLNNILHIATHGFFYMDPEKITENTEIEDIADNDLNFRGNSGKGYDAIVNSKNPLMRSGIVVAGANDIWSRSNFEGDDGVITAAEVSTLNMNNTELVVLSACETGLGDIKGSEGVYGLQRAFKMAGVHYMIMSLWQVPDKETAEFMTLFYGKLFELKDFRAAFAAAQAEMRSKYDPYFWAAFVLVE